MVCKINKNKNIGNVLFIVEGSNTEFYILKKIFNGLLEYTYEEKRRNNDFKYRKFKREKNSNSRVLVINSSESALTHIKHDNKFLDNLFASLIDYNFPIDKSAIYYIFDRDVKSNTDRQFILNLLDTLGDALDNGQDRQGLLLLSYPAIESYIAENFIPEAFNLQFALGKELKQYNHEQNINQQKISETTLQSAAQQMLQALKQITGNPFNFDTIKKINNDIFNFEEAHFDKEKLYRVLSLFSIILLDLGILEIL